MASTYSSNLKIELIATGEQSGVWGTTTNNNFTNVFEQAIVGRGTANFPADADLTLTYTDTVGSQTARNVYLNATSGVSLTQTRNLIVPTINKNYVVQNNTTGSQSIVVKTSAGTGITVPNGFSCAVYVNGTDVIQASDYFPVVTATQVNITGQGDLRLEDTSGGQYVALQAPSTVASSYTLTMPVDDGTNGQALITDGNGNLSWSTAASGDVYGPASATDNAITRFDGTTGKLVQNSSALVDDAGNVLAGAGLVGAPAFSTTGDTNTGIFFPAADTIAFTEGGVEAMRIDSSGNVGIGTSSPSYKLDIQSSGATILRLKGGGGSAQGSALYGTKSSNTDTLYAFGDNASIVGGTPDLAAAVYTSASIPLLFYTSNAERMRIDSSGNVFIAGTTAPVFGYEKLGVYGAGGFKAADSQVLGLWNTANTGLLQLYTGGGTDAGGFTANGASLTLRGGSNLNLSATGASVMTFSTNSAERMRIDSSGNVMIGGTTTTSATGYTFVNALGSNGGSFEVYSGTTRQAHFYCDSASAVIGSLPSIPLILRTNSAERMRITSGGDVGIGTSSPAERLDVQGTGDIKARIYTTGATLSTHAGLSLKTGSYEYLIQNLSTTAGSAGVLRFYDITANAERMRIDSSGNVGIGTTSPSGRLHIASTGNIISYVQSTNGGTASLSLLSSGVYEWILSGDTSLRFVQDATERMRITSGGDLLVGTTTQGTNQKSIFKMATSSAWPLTLDGNNRGLLVVQSASSGIAAYFTTSTSTVAGEISVSGSTTTYTTSSDYRLKENITPMSGALAKVQALKPCTYTWKEDGSAGQGFIAHELQAVVPDAVTGEKDGEQMQGVDYGKITPLLTAALQEALAKIESLEARLAALESK